MNINPGTLQAFWGSLNKAQPKLLTKDTEEA